MVNSGNMAANWEMITPPPAWLSLSKTNGYAIGIHSSYSGNLLGLIYSVDPTGLPAGTYTATNQFTADTMDGSATEIVELVISDSDLFIANQNIDAAYNGATVAQNLLLENNGSANADWSVAVSASWLTVSPTSGTLLSGTDTNLLLSVDPTNLLPGNYTTTNIFSSPTMSDPFEQVVSLTVNVSALSIADHTFDLTYNGPANQQTIVLTNAGTATAEWSLLYSGEWLSISETNGALEAGGSVDLLFTADPTGLPAGSDQITVVFDASSMVGAYTQTLERVINTSNLSIPGHHFTAQANAFTDPEIELNLSNSGAGAAEWSVSDSPSWLSISPSFGSIAGGGSTSLQYQVHSSGMSAGTYTATNIFSAASMLGSYTQQVTFTVTDSDFYVALDGNDADDGTSWATAKQTIQAAVNAQNQSGGYVWVSNGTYTLSSEVMIDKAIALKSWSGTENTILEGTDNTRCLKLSNCSIEGFTIRNGYAGGMNDEDGTGGGSLAKNTEILNCIFESNKALYGGGGLAADSCIVSNCLFSDNEAEVIWINEHKIYGGAGGGAAFHNSQIHNSQFSDNEAHYGGGATLNNSSAIACEFSDNRASCHGGGAFVADECNISNALFAGNSASTNGGALYFEGGNSIAENIIASNNIAGAYGGGIYIYDKYDTVGTYDSTCDSIILQNNFAGINGGGAYLWHGGEIHNAVISSNSADINGGGISFRYGGSLYDAKISENTAGDSGGGIYFSEGGATYRCEVFNNTAITNGGGTYFNSGGYLRESTVCKNNAQRGAGIYHYIGGDTKNVLLSGNNASVRGGGVYCYKGGTLNGLTIADNSAAEYGSGFYAYNNTSITNTPISLENAIVWEASDPIYRSGADILIQHICSNESYTNGMEQLTQSNPQFIDPAGSNYQLQAQSPCINAGTNTNTRTYDLALNNRIMGEIIDLGAYEWDFETDSDSDGLPDAWELQYYGNSTVADPTATSANGVNSIGDCYTANLDPTDSDSAFEIVDGDIEPATVYFESFASRLYTLYTSTNLTEGSWNAVGSTRTGIGGMDSMIDTNTASAKFYKIEVKCNWVE
jgi:predicted outer membrane repeat protein